MGTRKEYVGGAAATTLAADLAVGALTFTVADATGYPTGAVGPFVIAIGRGTATEEKILCEARAGNTFTVQAGGRGYDGTSDVEHVTNAVVEHTIDAVSISESNEHANDADGSEHTNLLATATHGAQEHSTAQLADGAVTDAKLASNAVTTAKILDANVTTAKLANDAVTADKIAADAVGSSEIAADAVGADEIAAGAVGTTELADASVTQAKAASGLGFVQVVADAASRPAAPVDGDDVHVIFQQDTKKLYVYADGGWEPVTFEQTQIIRDQALVDSGALTSAQVTWAPTLTITAPTFTGTVRTVAFVHGRSFTSTGVSRTEVGVEISYDGGGTWDAGPLNLFDLDSTGSIARVGITANHAKAAVPTGDIQVRARIRAAVGASDVRDGRLFVAVRVT